MDDVTRGVVCPNCHGENLAARSPLIEVAQVGARRGFHCYACDCTWTPVEFSDYDRRFLRQERIAAD